MRLEPIHAFHGGEMLRLLPGVLCLEAVSLLLAFLLTRVMREKGFKTDLRLCLLLGGILPPALALRFGIGTAALQGLALFFVLLYASCSDLTNHTVDDCLWVMVGLLGLVSLESVGLPSMLAGALMVLVPQMLAIWLMPKQALGGADIKLSTALAFLLGWRRGLCALMAGLLLAVVVMGIVQRRSRQSKGAFALVPFLSVGALAAFFMKG